MTPEEILKTLNSITDQYKTLMGIGSRAPQRSEGEAAIPEAPNAASLPKRDARGHVPATFDALGAGPKYSYEDANESRFGPGR